MSEQIKDGGPAFPRAQPVKRTASELKAAPKPRCPAELEALSAWYFGTPLHLSHLRIYPRSGAGSPDAGAQYEVRETYNSYHGEGWLFSTYCIKGYDYSRDFWAHVIGPIHCGGIASKSYGQSNVWGSSNADRLKEFEECLRQNDSGQISEQFSYQLANASAP